METILSITLAAIGIITGITALSIVVLFLLWNINDNDGE